jgi:hypothetical protein
MATTSDPLGIDIACSGDLDPHFRLCHGAENLSNALCRRLSCAAGALESIGDDPSYGFNVADHLNLETSDDSALAAINASARNEMLKDPRVQSITSQAIAVPD